MGNAHANLRKGKSYQTDGQKIMQLADILKPYITKWLENYRNQDNLPVQPATIRAISLNAAQKLIKAGF